jgi:hypothetical protein
MKQHSFKQNYPWLLLLVWLYSCQPQDEIPMIEPIDNGHLIVSTADVPQVVYELQQSLRFKQEGKLFGINDGEQSLNLEIDWEQIYQLIDEQGKETYTFRIADGDGDFATFYNLVMKFSENGDPYTPFLMKYTMSEAYAQAFLETGGGASFEGSVQRILLSKSASTTASTANLEDPFGDSGVDTNPCPGEIPIGGGNTGGTDPSNVGDNCQMMLVTTTWYSQVCDASGCGAPTVVDITQSLEFVCDSDGATAAWSETECDPVDEEIPILEPIFSPCELMGNRTSDQNFINKLTYLQSNTNQNREVGFYYSDTEAGTSFSGVLMGMYGVHALGFLSLSSPVDGIMHTHFTGGLSVFSPQDLVSLFQMYQNGLINNVNTFSFQIVTASGTRYSIAIENEELFLLFGSAFLTDVNILSVYFFGLNITPSSSNSDNELSLLNLLEDNNSGLTLMSANDGFTEWKKLELGRNNTVRKTTCE